jgi:FKBP-type peptidyl-prolyl cis-trans isomerase
MAGTFTACTAEEKMYNSSLSPTVSTSVGVSASGGSSEMATTETMQSTEKATVSKETEPSGQNTKTEEKADSWQNSAVVSATNPIQKTQSEVKNNSRNTVNSNHSKSKSNAEKETEIPTEKPTQKPTQPPTKAKTVDVQYAVSACIAYGQQLGMKYDSSLNTGNASWFSPTNTSYYDSTSELTSNLKSDVEYAAYYYQSSGIAPSDLSFNVIAENNKIYVVYC